MTRPPSDADHSGGVTDMIERVARAIVALKSPLLASDEYWPKTVRQFRQMCSDNPGYAEGRSLITDAFRDARTAIGAMREPTPGMVHSGNSYVTGYEDMRSTSECWRAMIDAALRDGEG